jgi:c-di-GMP-binding flagellar brake protein YcgR
MEMPMTTANMLTEGQVVQLDLGGKTTALPCRVLGFGGSTVMLAPVVPASAPTADAILGGREGYVILDADNQVHALRARVTSSSEANEVVVAVTDSFRLGQRRQYSRAPLALPATVSAFPSGEAWETVTRDISAGGVRMARTGAAGEQAEALTVVLTSAAAGLRIETKADVVRRSQRDLSLRFSEIADGDVALLTQITVAYYRLAR